MKLTKTILAAGVFALAATAMSHGQTVVRVTGSTAYRASTVAAIGHLFDSNTFSMAYVGSAPTGVAANFRGTIGGVDYLIKTSFSGSEGGIQTVSYGAAPLTVKFIPNSQTTTAATANVTAQGIATGGTGSVDDPTTTTDSTKVSAEVPDIALSDTYQTSSVFRGTYKGKVYPNLTEATGGTVGVIPFAFVASNSATITNITSQLAQNLFSNGYVLLSRFTGNVDDTSYVVATGRDPDSGTRLSALAETGLGAAFAVRQYQPSDANGTLVKTTGSSVVKAVPWPASTVNTINVPVFQGGYAGGGDLQKGLSNVTSTDSTSGLQILDASGSVEATGGIFVSYLGTSDVNAAIGAGGKVLSYNGVSIYPSGTLNLTPVKEGQYSFWSYEHVYYKSTAVAAVKTFGNSLAAKIRGTDAVIKVTDMKVSRSSDGNTVQ